MGVEVKGAGDGVVIADRGCNDCNYGRNNSGWGSGWGAVGGALVGGAFQCSNYLANDVLVSLSINYPVKASNLLVFGSVLDEALDFLLIRSQQQRSN